VGDSREGREGAKRGEHGIYLGGVDGGARLEENKMLNSGGDRHGGGGGGGDSGRAERGGSGAYGLGFDEEELGPESDWVEGLKRGEHVLMGRESENKPGVWFEKRRAAFWLMETAQWATGQWLQICCYFRARIESFIFLIVYW
jgi:hypothetical protein